MDNLFLGHLPATPWAGRPAPPDLEVPRGAGPAAAGPAAPADAPRPLRPHELRCLIKNRLAAGDGLGVRELIAEGLARYPLDRVLWNHQLSMNKDSPDDFFAVYRQMRAYGVAPDIWTHNIFIDAFIESGRAEVALAIFRSLPASGLAADACTYTTLIKGLGRLGWRDTSMALHHAMRRAGVLGDRTYYSTLIHAVCPGIGREEAVDIHRAALAAGATIGHRDSTLLAQAIGPTSPCARPASCAAILAPATSSMPPRGQAMSLRPLALPGPPAPRGPAPSSPILPGGQPAWPPPAAPLRPEVGAPWPGPPALSALSASVGVDPPHPFAGPQGGDGGIDPRLGGGWLRPLPFGQGP